MSHDEFWPGRDDCIGAGPRRAKIRCRYLPTQYYSIDVVNEHDIEILRHVHQ